MEAILEKDDIKTESIFKWAEREFHEEINYTDSFTITPIGMINDDSNSVGRVHIGLALLIKGSSNTISIKSELTNGTTSNIKRTRKLL